MRIGNYQWIKYLYLIAIITLTSCIDTEESEFEKLLKEEDQLITNYLQDHNLEAERTESGIYYAVVKENNAGKALKGGEVVSIRYTMSTLSGKFVDSAAVTTEGKPIRFQYVNGGIIPQGINKGVSLMKEGERYRFYIPSVYSFSDFSYENVLPAHSILITDVEITKVEKEADLRENEKEALQQYIASHQLVNVNEHDSGFFYQITQEGSGELPKNGQIVKVAYKGLYLNDQVFDQSKENEPIQFAVGTNSVIPGFDMGIKQMKKGAKGRILIPSRLAFGRGIQVVPEKVRKKFLKAIDYRDWQPYEPVLFEVEVLDIR